MAFKDRLKSICDFHGTPHHLALAFGLGVALGIIPMTGAIAAAAVATILRLNLPLMVAGALLTNPITTPFVYMGSYWLGSWLIGSWPGASKIWQAVASIAAGNLILAVSLGLAGYLVALGLAVLLRKGQH